MLAGTTADALVLVHGGHLHRAVRTGVVHHLDGSRRAMASAVAARNAVGQDDAVFFHPYGVTSMDGGLFLTGNRLDGTGWTNLAAPCAFGATIAALERHDGLHKMLKIRRRTQHIVRATRNAELASSAMFLHVSRRNRARRRDRRFAFRCHLVLDDCQAAVEFHLGLGQSRRSAGQGRANQEGTAFGIHGFGSGNGLFGRIMQSVKLAFVQAVATDHTPRIIDRTVLEINGL